MASTRQLRYHQPWIATGDVDAETFGLRENAPWGCLRALTVGEGSRLP